MKRITLSVLVLLAAVTLLWGCGGGGFSQSGGSTKVTVSIGSAAASTAGARPLGATIPSEVVLLRLTVSSTTTPADMTPIVSTLDVTPGVTTYQLSITVPNGNRRFLLQAFDNTSTLRYRGDASMVLTGGTASLTIQMYSDVTPPSILSVSPVSGATDVALSTPVTVIFSEAMDNTTVTGATLTVTRGGTRVPGTVGYSGTTATFTPAANWSYSTSYTVAVTTGAEDLAGNAIASTYSGSFTTVAPTGTVSSPGFSPVAGTYTSAKSVTLSTSTTGATIRYTTDGSTPTSTTGTVYSSAIAVSATTTIKAIAYQAGLTSSSVTSATYTITDVVNSSPEFPIATTTGREMSIGAASDGTNYLVGIQGDQIATNNITARLVSASTGSLVGSLISTGRGGGAPHVAFDGTNFLMTWPDDALYPNDILYGQRISTSGQLVGSAFQIDNTRWQDGGPTLFDGSNYFIAYEVRDITLQSDSADIYGRFISPSGALLGSAIAVSTVPHGQRGPAISFDGTNILVAWTDGRNQSACYTDNGTHCVESDVYGQLITKSATGAAGVLSGGNFLINASSLPRDGYGTSAAFDGTNHLVIFPEETTFPNACPAGGCKWDIYGQFVTRAGAPTGSRIAISTTAPDHKFAGLVWNGSRYLVTWTENFGSQGTIVKGRYFDTSGAPVGSEQTLFSAAIDGPIPWIAIPFVNGSNYFTIVDRGIPGSDPFNFDAYTSADVYGKILSSVSRFDGTYTGTWSDTCQTCGDGTATGTFTTTLVEGAFTNISLLITSGTRAIRFDSGTVSSSGAITATGATPSQCSGSVSTITGQISTSVSGGYVMDMTYSRPASDTCAAEFGTITASY